MLHSPLMYLTLAVLALFLTSTCAAAVKVTICTNVFQASDYFQIEYATRNSTFADEMKAAYFPSLDVQLPLPIAPSFVSGSTPSSTSTLRAIILQEAANRCNLFIGPSITNVIPSTGSAIPTPLWIEPRSGSPFFDNGLEQPQLLRVSDSFARGEVKGVLAFLKLMKWKNVGTLVDTTAEMGLWYETFVEEASALNITVQASYTTPPSGRSLTAGTTTALTAFSRIPTVARILIIRNADLATVASIARTNKHIFYIFVGELLCSDSRQLWRTVSPSVCFTSEDNNELSDFFANSYLARDTTRFNQLANYLRPFRFDTTTLNTNRNIYTNSSKLVIDAALFGLHVLQRFYDANGRLPSSSAEGAAFVKGLAGDSVSSEDSWTSLSRRFSASQNDLKISGLTGEVSVDATGNRQRFVRLFQFMNNSDGGSRPPIDLALVEDYDNISWTSIPEGLEMFGGLFHFPPDFSKRNDTNESGASWGAPADRDGVVTEAPVEETEPPLIVVLLVKESPVPWWAYLLLAIGIAMLAIVLVSGVYYFYFAASGKNAAVRFAPKDPAKPVAIVFTDIQSSTMLWAECPIEMSAALDLHNAIIRRCIANHRGYEVKTIGDSFMVAFKSPCDAILFAASVQRDLHNADWTFEIDGTQVNVAGILNTFYTDADHSSAEEDGNKSAKKNVSILLYNGLRVRIGGSYGPTTIRAMVQTTVGSWRATESSEEATSYDYLGDTVNVASSLESAAHGGQSVFSKELLEAAHVEAYNQRKKAGLSVNVTIPNSKQSNSSRISTLAASANDGQNPNTETADSTPAPQPAEPYVLMLMPNSKYSKAVLKRSLGSYNLPDAQVVEVFEVSTGDFTERPHPPLRTAGVGKGIRFIFGENDRSHAQPAAGESESIRFRDNASIVGSFSDRSLTTYSRSAKSNTSASSGRAEDAPNVGFAEMDVVHMKSAHQRHRRNLPSLLENLAKMQDLGDSEVKMAYAAIDALLSVLSSAESKAVYTALLAKWRVNQAVGGTSSVQMKKAFLAVKVAAAALVQMESCIKQ